MSAPDFVVCLECESPIYTFEWDGGRVKEAVCPTCGNDQKDPVLDGGGNRRNVGVQRKYLRTVGRLIC